jgi:hypothetical protein
MPVRSNVIGSRIWSPAVNAAPALVVEAKAVRVLSMGVIS